MNARHRQVRNSDWVWLGLLLWLALGLRAYNLAGQSLWSEEGLNLYRAAQPVATQLTGQLTLDGVTYRDTVGPLYGLLLRAFLFPAGTPSTAAHIFLARYLAVLAGVLAVPLLYGLGRSLLNRRIGLAAAALLATAPAHVWLSQEVGPESWLLLFTLLLMWGGWRTGRAWFHRHQLDRPGLAMLLLGGLLTLLALPALPANPALTYIFIPGRSLWYHAAGLLGSGVARDLAPQWWRFAPAIILAASGAVALLAGRRRGQAGFLLAYLLGPLFVLAWLAGRDAAYNAPRHLYLLLPPFLLLLAAGWRWPWAHWRGRATALGWAVLLLNLAWLPVQYHGPELVKDDVRALAAALQALTRPGDRVLVQDAATALALAQYDLGQATLALVPPQNATAAMTAQAALAAVPQAMPEAGHRAWLVSNPFPRSGFPPPALVEWAEAQWPALDDQTFAWLWLPLRLQAYVPQPVVAALPAGVAPAGLDFGGELTLAGYEAPAQVQSGGLWTPTFYWQKQPAAAGQVTLFWRLADAQGQTWAQWDELLWPAYPPGFWPAGALVRYAPLVRLPAGLPPGDYQLYLQLVRTADGQPLPLNGGDPELLLVPNLAVGAAAHPAGLPFLPPYTSQRADFGPALTLLGSAVPAAAEYRPGYPVPVTLIWQVNERPPADYRLRLRLLDPAGQVVNERVLPPIRPDYPPTQWAAGTLLAGQSEILLPATLAEGRYSVQATLLAADADRPVGGWLGPGEVRLADVQVQPWPLATAFPPIPVALAADFGGAPGAPLLALAGYGLPAETLPAGGNVLLSLFWRGAALMDTGYTVFVHLTNEAGEVVAQADGVPVDGFRPTTSWRPGEALVDEHLLWLPADLPPGRYALYVGLYDPATGIRLPLFQDGQPQPDNRLFLTWIEVS